MLNINQSTLAVDIGSNAIKFLSLRPKKKKMELVALGTVPMPEGCMSGREIEDPEPIAEAIKKLLKNQKTKGKKIITAISGSPVIIKKIQVAYQSKEDLSKNIKFESEQYIPVNINEVNLDYHIISSSKEENRLDLLIVAIKKEIIEQYVNIFNLAGLSPVVIDIDAFAIGNSYEFIYDIQEGKRRETKEGEEEKKEVIALLNIGSSMTNINILEGGTTAFTRDMEFGGHNYDMAIHDQFELEKNQIEKLKRGSIVEGADIEEITSSIVSVTENLAGEIFRIFEFYQSSSGKSIDKIYISGGLAQMKDIDKFFAESIGIPTFKFNPWAKISYDPNRFDKEYLNYIGPSMAVCVGLALRKIDDKGN